MIERSTCTVGGDLGDRRSVACIYSPGVVVGWFDSAHLGLPRLGPEDAGARAAFGSTGFRTVAMEAGVQSGWVTRLPSPPHSPAHALAQLPVSPPPRGSPVTGTPGAGARAR
jgi:hypothetical protein